MRLGIFGIACALMFISAAPARAGEPNSVPVCGAVLPGFTHCDALAPRRSGARAATVWGYGPSDLQSAYGVTDVAALYGADQTVAIVDAYDEPNAESDLAVYRSHFGLRPCTTANGCFRKVNQYGTSTPPAHDAGWGTEISLDLDMVSAMCPHCHILLVEASSNSASALASAANRAAMMGATQISNSYGGDEDPSITALESYYKHPGVTVTASSGDYGYGVEYPASSAWVTAVGGTTLSQAANTRGWTETAWDGAGSGCSLYIAKPAWQTDTDCTTRTVADVSAVADPNTGVAVYDSDPYQGQSGWQVYGGTSAAAPIVAATYALTGSATATNYASYAYDNTGDFNDVTSGSNGSCTFAYLCTAGLGFDGPTGLGTPNSAHPTGPPPPDTVTDPGSGGGGSGGPAPTPAPWVPKPTPTPTPVPAQLRSSVSVSAGVVTASRTGRVAVRVSCGSGSACTGQLSLQVRGHGVRLISLGKARYSVQPGRRKLVRIHLTRSGLKLLSKRRRLRAYGTALDRDGTTAQAGIVLHATAKRRTKHR